VFGTEKIKMKVASIALKVSFISNDGSAGHFLTSVRTDKNMVNVLFMRL